MDASTVRMNAIPVRSMSAIMKFTHDFQERKGDHNKMNKLILLVMLTMVGCGPGAEEKARLQKVREDSIRLATEMATKLQIENKQALQNELQDKLSMKEGAGNRLSYLKAEIEVQKDKLNTIKQPQFLRTPEEREAQIRSQVLLIEGLQNEVTALDATIRKLEDEVNILKEKLKNL